MGRCVDTEPQHWPSDHSSSSWRGPVRNRGHWDLVYHRISPQPCSIDPCKIMAKNLLQSY